MFLGEVPSVTTSEYGLPAHQERFTPDRDWESKKEVILPPPVKESLAAFESQPYALPVVDWEQINRFREFWKRKKADPVALELLLQKIAVVTPEFRQRYEQFMIDQIQSYIQFYLDRDRDARLVLITTSGRSGRQMERMVQRSGLRHERLVTKTLGLTVREKAMDYQVSGLKREASNLNSIFVLLDDWSMTGQHIGMLYQNLERQRYDAVPNSADGLKMHVLLGGVNADALNRLNKNIFDDVIVSPYYGIPVAQEVFTPSEWDFFSAESAKLFPKRNVPQDERFLIHSRNFLTIESDRISDTFPAGLTDGVWDPIANQQEYLLRDKGRERKKK